MKLKPIPYLIGLSFYLFLLALPGASAQESSVSSLEKAGGRYYFHVVYFNYQKDPSSPKLLPGINLLFLDGGTEYKIAALEGSLSRAFRYTGLPSLTFYEESTNGEGARELLPLTKAELGDPGTKIIFIAKDRNSRFVSSVIDADTDDFEVNHVRVVNFSRHLIKAKVGEQVANIEPMNSFDYPVEGDSRRFRVRLAMAAMEEDGFNVFEYRKFAVRQGGRKLIVVHQKTNAPEMLDYTSIIVEEEIPGENRSDEDLEALDRAELFGPSNYSEGAD